MTVLCLVELDAGAAADASLRALAFARSLAGPAGSGGTADGLAAVLFSEAARVPLSELAGHGVADVYVIEPGQLPGYAPQAWARALAGLAAEVPATAVVAAATDRGNEVLAHVGAITELPMAANCTAAGPADRGVHRIVRQRWAGLLLEQAILEGAPALLTVAAETVAAETVASQTVGAPTRPSVHLWQPTLAPGDLLVRATESGAQRAGQSLATARVVVGGGRGVGGADGFAPLEELAGLLGGVVGVSRVVTSEGWRPHRQQVGQTGTRIAPDLYLACGISGAIQHMAGCQSARHIVAINTDPEAPIISHADYAVIGDLHEVIPALTAAIQARSAGDTGN